jgi:hypothetical protein
MHRPTQKDYTLTLNPEAWSVVSRQSSVLESRNPTNSRHPRIRRFQRESVVPVSWFAEGDPGGDNGRFSKVVGNRLQFAAFPVLPGLCVLSCLVCLVVCLVYRVSRLCDQRRRRQRAVDRKTKIHRKRHERQHGWRLTNADLCIPSLYSDNFVLLAALLRRTILGASRRKSLDRSNHRPQTRPPKGHPWSMVINVRSCPRLVPVAAREGCRARPRQATAGACISSACVKNAHRVVAPSTPYMCVTVCLSLVSRCSVSCL